MGVPPPSFSSRETRRSFSPSGELGNLPADGWLLLVSANWRAASNESAIERWTNAERSEASAAAVLAEFTPRASLRSLSSLSETLAARREGNRSAPDRDRPASFRPLHRVGSPAEPADAVVVIRSKAGMMPNRHALEMRAVGIGIADALDNRQAAVLEQPRGGLHRRM